PVLLLAGDARVGHLGAVDHPALDGPGRLRGDVVKDVAAHPARLRPQPAEAGDLALVEVAVDLRDADVVPGAVGQPVMNRQRAARRPARVARIARRRSRTGDNDESEREKITAEHCADQQPHTTFRAAPPRWARSTSTTMLGRAQMAFAR